MSTEAYIEVMAYNLRRRLQAEELFHRATQLTLEGRSLEAELILAQRDAIMRGTQWTNSNDLKSSSCPGKPQAMRPRRG